MHGSGTGFDNASLSHHIPFFSVRLSYFPLSLSRCGLIRLNYTEVLLFIIDMGHGLSSQTLNKY